jgi:hypothetical protein
MRAARAARASDAGVYFGDTCTPARDAATHFGRKGAPAARAGTRFRLKCTPASRADAHFRPKYASAPSTHDAPRFARVREDSSGMVFAWRRRGSLTGFQQDEDYLFPFAGEAPASDDWVYAQCVR